jgi:intracellular sulfur oxidation DsrE/DsrF family protein
MFLNSSLPVGAFLMHAAARLVAPLAILSLGLASAAAQPGSPAAGESGPPRLSLPLEFPQIEGYGSVVALPEAGERPRIGGRVVFDTTAAAPAGKPNRGLESAARLVNLYAKEGLSASRPQIAVILHFNATAAALTDAAHERTGGGSNPNRELVEKLLDNGVEVWVCGQSVVRGGHALADILPGVKVAHSAMIFNLNRQQDGWASLGVH